VSNSKVAAAVLLALCTPAFAGWLEKVSPIMTPDEKKAYLALRDVNARAAFEDNFWSGKQITADEYERRLAYIQSSLGPVNTDQGRVYLSLGAPSKISRLSSTRSFWPLEIWYYDTAPNIGFSGALQLMFFQKNETGQYRLYSPSLDTFTALLNPQAGTRGMFRVNDLLSEGDIRNNMNLTPAETEIVDAALGVARGVKGVENEHLIGLATSPEAALSRTAKFRVNSRLLSDVERPVLTTFQSWSEDGVPVIDLSLEARLKTKIGISVSVEESETTVPSFEGKRVRYQHRLTLLPGAYTVVFNIDGLSYPFPLEVSGKRETSSLLVGRMGSDKPGTPFEFGPAHIDPTSEGPVAFVQLTHRQTVKWRLRQNANVVAAAETEPLPGNFAMFAFNAPAGRYTLELRAGDDIREREVQLGTDTPPLPTVSYNANLSPALRARSLGRQWLARGNLVEARTWLERARSIQPSDAVTIDLCRVSAMAGDLDSPRPALTQVLDRDPDNFEALTILGYIEAQLQDYTVAASYYKKALAIRNSPTVAEALAQLSRLTH
jgi:GWxTD domain-containing protein